jgi:putative two-component system response regulator
MFSSLLKGLSSARVLAASAEPVLRDGFVAWLREAGYSCSAADSADAAWEHLQHHRIDLAIVDVETLGEAAAGLLQRIAAHSPDTAVLTLTSVRAARVAIDAFAHGAAGYLLKPVEREELLFHAQRALERRQLILDNRAHMQHLEQEIRHQNLEVRRAHEETVYRLVAASASRDGETAAHIRRTGLYSEVVAEMAGWPRSESENIRLAAPMHDIGKIGVPEAVLLKPGKLTDEEFEVMKSHAEIGARMLAGSSSAVLQMAEQIARHHHEQWDGKGYPQRLAGPAIPQCARIVAIVDVYDALSHDRVYRPAMPEEQVVAILEEGKGTHFDPDLLTLFLQALPEMRRTAQNNPDERPTSPKESKTAPAPFATAAPDKIAVAGSAAV